jgi:hypothetical protein
MIYVKVQNGYELDELHDVLITSLANNNMIKWDAGSNVWRNVAGPAGDVVGTTDTQTLSNKTISGGTVTGAAVTGLAAPTAPSDAATKAYVDSVTEGLDVKGSCRVATTANITLSGTQTIDGVAVTVGDRVLVKDQSTASQNGIYVVAAGAWTRSSDADAWTELVSAFTFIEVGTVNVGSGYTCTVAAGGTLGSTPITWSQFSNAGQLQPGAGLTRTGNTLDVATASSARIVVNPDSIDLATTGVTASTYKSVTVDEWGRVTGGSNPTTLAGFGITDAYTKTYIDTLYGDTASAAASAAAAAASYDSFDDRWLGAKTSDPALDNDGNALQAGAVYFSTTLTEMRVYTGSAWQTATTLPSGVFQRSFTATAGQSTYTWTGGSYAVGFLYVYVNGVLLSTSEYTATDGFNVSFSTALTLADEVQMLTFKAAGTVAVADIAGLQTALDSKLATSAGAVGTSNLAANAVTPAKMANGGAEFGMRNRIINGNFAISQRGSFSTAPVGTTYTVDRWYVSMQNSPSFFAAAGTSPDFLQTSGFPSCLLVTGYASNSVVTIGQRIEYLNCQDMVDGVAFTVGVWLFSSEARTVTWSIDSANAKDNFSAVTNVASGTFTSLPAGVGVYRTFTFTTTSNCLNGIQLSIGFGTVGMGSIFITGVQLEKGSTATPFEFRPYSTELALCQRYFCKTYNVDIAPGTPSNPGMLQKLSVGTNIYDCWSFPVAMRSAPSVTVYNAATGASGTWNDGTTGARSVGVSNIGTATVNFVCTTVASGALIQGHLVASAEL